MSSDKPSDDLFGADGEIGLKPNDGYRVTPLDNPLHGGRLELHIELYSDDELVKDSARIWEAPNTHRNRGRRAALLLVGEAICRYLNTGGDWNDFDQLSLRFVEQCQPLHLGSWYLISSQIDPHGHAEHLFYVDDSVNVLRWVEGQFVELIELSQLEIELDAGSEERHGTLPRLLGPPSAQDAGEDSGAGPPVPRGDANGSDLS